MEQGGGQPALDEIWSRIVEEREAFRRFVYVPRPSHAELLRRIDLSGESQAEVAADLGITLTNLGVRLLRARRALRAGIEHSCGPCADESGFDCRCSQTFTR